MVLSLGLRDLGASHVAISHVCRVLDGSNSSTDEREDPVNTHYSIATLRMHATGSVAQVSVAQSKSRTSSPYVRVPYPDNGARQRKGTGLATHSCPLCGSASRSDSGRLGVSIPHRETVGREDAISASEG